MAVTIRMATGKRIVLGTGDKAPADAWKSTLTARSDGGAAAKRLKDALDRSEQLIKATRFGSRKSK